MVAAVPYQPQQWWDRIVREIHDGTGHTDPDPVRARELEVLAAAHDPLLPAHVWPRMEAIFCWTSGLASLYLPRLREEFGADVSVLPAPVAASEGPVAVPLDRHGSAGSPVVTAAAYEFVDADEELRPDSATLELTDLVAAATSRWCSATSAASTGTPSATSSAWSTYAVWCANTVQYLDDDALARALGGFRRVVRPGGLVAIKEIDATLITVHPGSAEAVIVLGGWPGRVKGAYGIAARRNAA